MEFFLQSKLIVDDSSKIKELILKLKGYLDSLLSTCTNVQIQVGLQATALEYQD